MKFYLILLLFVFSCTLSAQGAERLHAEVQAQQQVVNTLYKEIGISIDANADLAYVEGLQKNLDREEEALRRKRKAYEDALSDNPYLQLNGNVLKQLDRDGKGALYSLNQNTVGPDFYKKYTGYILRDGLFYYLYPAALVVTTSPYEETGWEEIDGTFGRFVSTVTPTNDSLMYRGLVHLDCATVHPDNGEDCETVKHRATKTEELPHTYESTYTEHEEELSALKRRLFNIKRNRIQLKISGSPAEKQKLLDAQEAILKQQVEGVKAAAIFAVNLEARRYFDEAWKERLSTVDGYLTAEPWGRDFYFKFREWAIRKNPETDKE